MMDFGVPYGLSASSARLPELHTAHSTKTESLAATLREAIITGIFTQGQQFPGVNRIKNRYKLSVETVRRALMILEQEGFIKSAGNRGHFVCWRKKS